MHEPPIAFVAHKAGNRIRLKIPSKKKDSDYFALLAEKLSSLSGLLSVEVNSLTGSVLLVHASGSDQFVRMSQVKDLFRIEKQNASVRTNLQGRISETFEGIDVALKDISGNELDLGGTAFLALLAMGIYQVIRGNVTAIPWYAAGWYALNIFLKSNTDRPPAL